MEHSAQKKTYGKASIIWISFWVLVFTGMGGIYGQTVHTRFTKKLAAYDLNYLKDGLKAIHPYPFTYTSEEDFNRLVDLEVAALHDTVDYFTLRNAARRIVHYIHCVHSTVLSRKISSKEALFLDDKYLPLEVRWIGSRLYVFKNYSNDTILCPGAEILSINEHPVQSITDSIKAYRSGDGTGIDFIRGLTNLPFQFNFLFDLYFPDDSIYTVRFLDSLDNERTVVLAAIYEPQEPVALKDTQHYAFSDKHKNVLLRFIANHTALLKIKDFGGEQILTYKKVFKKIGEAHTQNLIIDLRSDYGGSMDNANELISYLVRSTVSFSLETPLKINDLDYYDGLGRAQRLGGLFYFTFMDKGACSIRDRKWYWQTFIEPKGHYAFRGNVYVLINEHTLSAASYAAAQLKHKAGAILVGSPAGGGEFGNAGYTYTTFTLPNSNSRIKVPHNWINYEITGEPNHALYPQHIVYPTIRDILLNRDAVLDSTMSLIDLRVMNNRTAR